MLCDTREPGKLLNGILLRQRPGIALAHVYQPQLLPEALSQDP